MILFAYDETARTDRIPSNSTWKHSIASSFAGDIRHSPYPWVNEYGWCCPTLIVRIKSGILVMVHQSLTVTLGKLIGWATLLETYPRSGNLEEAGTKVVQFREWSRYSFFNYNLEDQ